MSHVGTLGAMTDADGAGDALVLRDVRDHVARLTLNDPARRNALSTAMLGALAEQLDVVGTDPDVHVVVLAAAGPAFSAGHDLREIRADPDPGAGRRGYHRC